MCVARGRDVGEIDVVCMRASRSCICAHAHMRKLSYTSGLCCEQKKALMRIRNEGTTLTSAFFVRDLSHTHTKNTT